MLKSFFLLIDMKVFNVVVALLLLPILGKGQYRGQMLDVDNYRHTVSNGMGKFVFRVLSGDGKSTGTSEKYWYSWYSGNEIHSTQGGYSGRLLHGEFLAYYPTRGLKQNGIYDHGLKSGKWTFWRENGTLESVLLYRKGIAEGRFVRYDSLGHASELGKYRNGVLHGRLLRYISMDGMQVTHYNKGIVIKQKASRVSVLFSRVERWIKGKRPDAQPRAERPKRAQ